jgi:predicted anti-sigma-YlaC factor YlaD
MSHEDIRSLLSAFIDHELEASEEAIVVEHIKSCSDCRIRMNHMVTLKRNVHAAGNYELPYLFASALTRSIHREEEVEVSWDGIEHYVQKFVLGLAMFVLLLIGLTTFRQSDEPVSVDRYLSGLSSDSAAAQILTKHGSVTRDDVVIAAFTR